MLRVTIEIIPFGNKKETKELGQIHIINDGTGTKTHGNYIAKFYKDDKEIIGKRVKGFFRSFGFYALIMQVLKENWKLLNDKKEN